jgi:hypothetical protein
VYAPKKSIDNDARNGIEIGRFRPVLCRQRRRQAARPSFEHRSRHSLNRLIAMKRHHAIQ